MGFFNIDTIEKVKLPEKNIPSCSLCGLKKSTSGPLKPYGKGKKGILIIGKSPSKKEDIAGCLLSGQGTSLLKNALKKHGIDLYRDCIKINAIACRTTKKKNESSIASCRPTVMNAIKKYKPKLIILAGIDAVQSVLGGRVEKIGELGKWRGYCIPDRKLNTWVCPIYHPNFVLHDKSPAAELIFNQDIDRIQYHLKKPVPTFQDESENVRTITDVSETKKFLRLLIKKQPKLIAIDWETTGLKPHHPQHKIVSCSITYKPGHAVAFLISPKIHVLLNKVLTDFKIKKIAANLKFEELWSRTKLGVAIHGWIWDTMIAEHVLDNRPGITGLKFQTYVHYGLDDYDSHLSHLLKSSDKSMGANAFNKIHEIPVQDLLIYNGVDTIFEYRRAIDQMKRFGILDPLYYAKNYRG